MLLPSPLLLPTLLSLLAGASASRHHARSYDTHAYYALELDSSLDAAQAATLAQRYNVELIERIGELDGHWLVRAPHAYEAPNGAGVEKRAIQLSHTTNDPVLRRWRASIRDHRQEKKLISLPTRQRSKRVVPEHVFAAHSPQNRQHAKTVARPRWKIEGLPLAAGQAPDENLNTTELVFAQLEVGLKDPMLSQQWHLINTKKPEWELNVTGTWANGTTGQGVTVAIIDDGLDYTSDDLASNFFAEGSYDFNDHTDLPLPRLSDDQHGTRCAGEIAAAPNDVCGVGVSYNAKVAGVRILSAPISDADEAAALNYEYQKNDIYSCSWGPPDDGKSMEAPDGLILKAMVNGVQKGRGGKGSVFVFAAGNGGGSEDQCNFDGYTNSIFSITVGAVDRRGLHPYYSEQCSAMMIVAPSSGSGDHIHTTDVGKNRCAHTHGGTSAAAPLAVGVLALALQVRPELTWRDVQHIAIETAKHINDDDPDWQLTATGRNYSYKYGFGMIDAGRFVELAQTFQQVKPQTWFDSPAVYLPKTEAPSPAQIKRQIEGVIGAVEGVATGEPPTSTAVPGSDEGTGGEETGTPIEEEGSYITADGVSSTFSVTQEMLDDSNFEKLEHITVRVWILHERRGDVEAEITSPNGITSMLAWPRRFDEDANGFWGWKFMSLKHWGENPVGEWTITVRDRRTPEKNGRFIAWALQLWGEVVDPALARDWAPAEEGQDDEEETGSQATHTTVSQKPKPTEHLPDDHGDANADKPDPDASTPTPAPNPDPTETGTGDGAQEEEGDYAEGGWFSGVSNLASNTTWMAGAGGIILVAGAGIGGYFAYRQRQKRRSRNLFGLSNDGEGARGAYAPVSEDVPMGLLDRTRRGLGRGGAGGAGGAQSKELYDAFGDGPSDDETSIDDDGIDVGPVAYHDGFLDDEEDGGVSPGDPGQRGTGQGYRDEDADDLPPREEAASGSGSGSGGDQSSAGAGGAEDGTGHSASSSNSWLDTAEEVGRP